MSITLTVNYKETLSAAAAEKVHELLEENYDLSAMLEFIDTYNENDFVNYYEEYVRVGEAIGYDAVDALIGEMGCVSDIEDCDERFRGWYESTADFAEQYTTDVYGDVSTHVVVDWEATWDSNLYSDFTACRKGYREVAVFSDY